MKRKQNIVLVFLLTSFLSFAQTSDKPFKWENSMDNIVMTWNKNTPEQEMKDDIKALAEHGVTINYSNVKRNDKNEITAIDVSFEATTGEKGSLSYDNKKPIGIIKIYKQGDEVGFGEPSNIFENNSFVSSFIDEDNQMKKFNFTFPDNDSKSKIMIKRNDRAPLVIEDGKIVEGGDDYSKEELEELLKKNDTHIYGNGQFKSFSFGGNKELKEELEKMQEQLNKLIEKQEFSGDQDLEQSKKELDKAKQELEEAKKELEKTKSSLKVKKA